MCSSQNFVTNVVSEANYFKFKLLKELCLDAYLVCQDWMNVRLILINFGTGLYLNELLHQVYQKFHLPTRASFIDLNGRFCWLGAVL